MEVIEAMNDTQRQRASDHLAAVTQQPIRPSFTTDYGRQQDGVYRRWCLISRPKQCCTTYVSALKQT